MSLTYLPWSILWTFPWCNLNLFTQSQASNISQYFYQLFNYFQIYFFLELCNLIILLLSYCIFPYSFHIYKMLFKTYIKVHHYCKIILIFFFYTKWPFLPLKSPIRLGELLPVHSQYHILPFLGCVLYLRAGPFQCVCQSALANGFPPCEANGRQWRKTVKWEKIGSQL